MLPLPMPPFPPPERIARLDRPVAELVAQCVHRGFGLGAAAGVVVDEVGRVGGGGVGEVGDADAEQAVFGAVEFPLEQRQAFAKNAVGELGMGVEAAVAG